MLRLSSRAALALVALLVAAASAACDTGSKSTPPAPAPSATPEKAPTADPGPSAGALRLGAPIEASAQKVALADVAKTPSAYVGKTFATTGTVTAVCQHMGCWMELKDDAGEAHIKMAGHAFFVPKTASGKKARVLAKLVKADDKGSCEGEGHDKMAAAGESGGAAGAKGKGCRAEAEEQLGRPLAKLELVADGVELM